MKREKLPGDHVISIFLSQSNIIQNTFVCAEANGMFKEVNGVPTP